jgi:hypothetical protein
MVVAMQPQAELVDVSLAAVAAAWTDQASFLGSVTAISSLAGLGVYFWKY